MEIFNIKLVGLSAENGRKLLLTLALIAVVVVARLVLNALTHPTAREDDDLKLRWSRTAESEGK